MARIQIPEQTYKVQAFALYSHRFTQNLTTESKINFNLLEKNKKAHGSGCESHGSISGHKKHLEN